MCDYSLHGIKNRLATEGEQLVVYRFPTNSLGLACPADVRLPERTGDRRAGVWSNLRHWFAPERKPVAVCIPPGARLLMRDIPPRLQQQLGVSEEEEVTFTQLTASANCYRDAVRFRNGSEVLLQRLEEGQRVDVLSLSLQEPAEKPPRYAIAMRNF